MRSVYDRILNSVSVTTDSFEAWHRILIRKSAIKSPNLANFVIMMERSKKNMEVKFLQLKNGKMLNNSGKRIAKTLEVIVNNFYQYDGIEYLFEKKTISLEV
ncbi:hypothetical protein DMUE_0483 [Dictyocoela muelleri]|nr:hypothetical protein DMUE_0483 [Dictyocoela muelleri]